MTQFLPPILKVVIFFLLPVVSFPQSGDSLSYITTKKHDLNHSGMAVLTGWASANILSGAGYFISRDPGEKYFYAMNAGWGLVNLAIALPGLKAKKPVYKSKYELLKNQTKTEKIFLANVILDLVYITGGFLLKEVSKNQSDNNVKAMCSGFGDSFILQGSGLFAFDLTMTSLNNRFRKKHIDNIMSNTLITFRPGKIGLIHYF